MKVEQLKAELVVFKGLMSNVSAATSSPKAGRAGPSGLGLSISCPLPPPGLLCFSLCLPPTPPSVQEEKKEQKSQCRI